MRGRLIIKFLHQPLGLPLRVAIPLAHTIRAAGAVRGVDEVHDLRFAKAVTGRPKDLEFCAALKRAGLVRAALLEERLPAIEIDERLRALVAARIQAP